MNERKRYVWEENDTMYIHDTIFCNRLRILNYKTNKFYEIDDQLLIQKTIQNGVEVVSLTENL